MKLKRLVANNFLSFGTIQIDFEKLQGLTIIEGVNKDSNPVCSNGCHVKGQKVILFNGKLINVEDVEVGDQLMGPDSQPRNVLQLCRGRGKLYKIKPKRGQPFIVNEDHILSLKYNDYYHESHIENISVKDYLDGGRALKWSSRLYRVPITFTKGPELGLDPYYVGILLGDGSISKGVGLTSMDPEIVKYFEDYSKSIDENIYIRVSEKKGTINKAKFYSASHPEYRKNPIIKKLRDIGIYRNVCEDKFIPYDYKIASREDRLQLLAGLMDTDGHLHNNGFDYVSKSRQLVEDISFVSRSVGLKVSPIVEKFVPKICDTTYYRINISGNTEIIPCKLPRKQASPRRQIKDPLVEGFSIEYVGEGDYYGFCLDGDHLYLLDDFTVTHNSGKSSLWEAVTFGLFGRTIRKTRESSIVRHNAKSCTVDLELDMDGTNVFIQRGRKPSKLFVSIDGKDITRESAIETQKFLCEYLNLDFTTYLAAVMFGQNNNSDFINSSPSDKRKILQAFLGINDYFEIREVVRVNKKQHKRNITELEGEKKAHLKHIESAQKQQESVKRVDPIEDCEQKLDNWKQYHQAKDFVEKEESKLVNLKNKLKRVQSKLDSIEDTGECPTCKQKLKTQDVKKSVIEDRDSLEESIREKGELIKYPLQPNHETEQEINEYLAFVKYQESAGSIQKIIEESEAELEIVHKALEEETRQLILCEYWEQAFSEQGLVKYIIRNIIDFFNTQVNYYLSLITNGHLTITFSQSLSETLFSGKSLVEYNAMSGGERKKVNLAVMLGLHDLLRFNKKSTPDFAIFDEITEIDQAGIRNISSLMKKIAEEHNKKVFMITHNPDLLGEIDKYNKVVVQKRNGKSKIKEIKYAG